MRLARENLGIEIEKRIVHKVRNLYFLCPNSKNELNVTISAGVVSPDNSIKSFDVLILKADRLLYQAKLAGRNCVKYQNTLGLRPKVGLGNLLCSFGTKVYKRLFASQ